MDRSVPTTFPSRSAAGRQLADSLTKYRGRDGLVILGLPRGGLPVAAEIAQALEAPLDVFLVRKLGVPGHEELAMGAVAEGGFRVLNEEVTQQLDIRENDIEAAATREKETMLEQGRLYRDGRSPRPLDGCTVILVDDGLATGATMRVAVEAVRHRRAAHVVVAVPVAPPSACHRIEGLADEVVCLSTPGHFVSVGSFYEDFSQVSDEQVRGILHRFEAASRTPSP